MKRALAIAGRLALAAIFIYSAYAKLKDPWYVFAASIDSYHLVPPLRPSGWPRPYPGSN